MFLKKYVVFLKKFILFFPKKKNIFSTFLKIYFRFFTTCWKTRPNTLSAFSLRNRFRTFRDVFGTQLFVLFLQIAEKRFRIFWKKSTKTIFFHIFGHIFCENCLQNVAYFFPKKPKSWDHFSHFLPHRVALIFRWFFSERKSVGWIFPNNKAYSFAYGFLASQLCFCKTRNLK